MVRWIRFNVKRSLENNSKFSSLKAEERGVFVTYCLLAGKSPTLGSLCVLPGVGYSKKQLSALIGIPQRVLKRCNDALVKAGFITIEGGTISVSDFPAYIQNTPNKPKKAVIEKPKGKPRDVEIKAQEAAKTVLNEAKTGMQTIDRANDEWMNEKMIPTKNEDEDDDEGAKSYADELLKQTDEPFDVDSLHVSKPKAKPVPSNPIDAFINQYVTQYQQQYNDVPTITSGKREYARKQIEKHGYWEAIKILKETKLKKG